MEQTQMCVRVSKDVLASANMSEEEFKALLECLAMHLKKRFPAVVPQEINGYPTLKYISDIRKYLAVLESCDGFDRHIKTYAGEHVASSHFVARIASSLKVHVDELVLEPLLASASPDILVNLGSERVYLECKTIQTSRHDNHDEHRQMFQILKGKLSTPHQVDITYRSPLSDAQIVSLAELINQRSIHVTADGTIIDTPQVTVQLLRRESAGSMPGLCVELSGVSTDIYENCGYPMHLFFGGGFSVSISGPIVDYTPILLKKIEKSRHQACDAAAFILVINNSMLLGDLSKNVKSIQHAFQPSLNTRFSGLLLVPSMSRGDSKDSNTVFISNPYAKFPVSNKFRDILKTL